MNNQLQDIEKSQEKIDLAFQQADHIIMRKYMPEIYNYPIKKASEEIAHTNINGVFRLNKIEKIVYDAEENNLDKLMNIYNSVALCGGSIVNIICCDGDKVEYYIGVKSANINETATCQSALMGTFEGNFPGSKMIRQEKSELSSCLNKVFKSSIGEQNRVISIVSGIPGLRNEESKEFVQGMEKLIDSMGNRKYAIVTIAEPVKIERLMEVKENYEDIYSKLSPFSKITATYSESDSSAIAESITESVTQSVGNTINNSVNSSTTVSSGKNKSAGASCIFLSANLGTSSGISKQSGTSYGDSKSETSSNSNSRGSTDTYTTTTGKTMQLAYENKRVTDLLKQIENQIQRIEDAKDMGLWNTATYCLADDVQTSKTLASTMQSLCRGKKNTVENYSINTWTDPYKLKNIEEYLTKMMHPTFEMNRNGKIIELTPASLISGKELVISAGLPQKSVNGVAISKMVPFARNIVVEDMDNEVNDSICVGSIFHMGRAEQSKVLLDVNSLSSHVLITGSTGSGKSNTVYSLITELKKKNMKFLIIEPAKGEYKNVFGNDDDVNVYGTNSKWTELLRINPFSFPEDIHILEHIDRLVEIFNVCWPMYAAMPAVLKDAILQSYKKCGWNLDLSENIYGKRYFPTCMDLQKQIVQVIHSSAYSDEVKGNYIGSLATRVNSLTNGINGQMFVNNEISETDLFDSNTIIDLSRVGSLETKSLIMGILVMKLNEYRIASSKGKMNQPLKHITVLEEAHNLLRNTNGKTASSEEGNMAGKSVEMLSNSIAEMRTYGEGFIIVDQSPSAVDISAIRNTNTKILMRLPEESDRNQAGKAAAMTEKQIPELARLPKGIAVIYQNNWLDPVLCKIMKAPVKEEEYIYSPFVSFIRGNDKAVKKMIVMLLVGNRIDELLDISSQDIKNNIDKIRISTETRIKIMNAVESLENGENPGILSEESFGELSEIVCEVLDYKSFESLLYNIEDEKQIQIEVGKILANNIGTVSRELELAITQCILRNMVSRDENKIDLYSRWREFAVNQRELVQ